jgi:TetR/AcrR family transcriptional repressor of nem operon
MRFLRRMLLAGVKVMNKGEMTRQRIIAEAAPLFNQRGYAGCSMQDVLDATGLEKGGLYRHFASKEELAVEAFRYALANVVRTRTENIEQIDSTVERLRYLIRRFVESPSMMPGGCPLMNTAIDNDDGNPALRQLALEGIQAWKARLVAIVDAGIERGEIRGEIEPRRIANTIVAALEGALMMSRLEDNKAALKDVAESLEVVLDGIASR